jgi:hypothetical protein
MTNFRPTDRLTGFLMPPSVDEWLPQKHLTRFAVELIVAATTKTGLKVRCELDTRLYPKGIKVSSDEMATLNIKGDAFHPEWNYSIGPECHPEAVIVGRRLSPKK